MKLANLTVDDFYLSTQQDQSTGLLKMSLGQPFQPHLATEVYFDGYQGWAVVDDYFFRDNKFTASVVSKRPTVFHHRLSLGVKHQVLFFLQIPLSDWSPHRLFGSEVDSDNSAYSLFVAGVTHDILRALLVVPSNFSLDYPFSSFTCT